MFYDLRPRGMGNGITYRKPVEDPNSPDYHPLKAFGPLEAAPIHVQEVLALARRALIIPEKWVADARAPHPIGGAYWADIDDYAETVVESFELDPQGAQPVYVEILCEAEDLAPRLARIAGEFGVTVYSGGGFDGLKAKRLCGERAVRRSVPTVILHVGDYDKHGLAIYDAAAEDALAWFDFFSASRYTAALVYQRAIALIGKQIGGGAGGSA